MAKTPPRPEPPAATSSHPIAIGIAVIVILALGGYFVLALNRAPVPEPAPVAAATPVPAPAPATTPTPGPTPAPASTPATSTAPLPEPEAPPVQAARPAQRKPAAKGPLPPLPMLGFAPPRPIDTVRAVFEFAARRPDVLEYVPCFCGCERSGHKGNDDCFVKSRAANGDVEWEPHGMS